MNDFYQDVLKCQPTLTHSTKVGFYRLKPNPFFLFLSISLSLYLSIYHLSVCLSVYTLRFIVLDFLLHQSFAKKYLSVFLISLSVSLFLTLSFAFLSLSFLFLALFFFFSPCLSLSLPVLLFLYLSPILTPLSLSIFLPFIFLIALVALNPFRNLLVLIRCV